MKCPYCGRQIPDNARFCAHCGKPMPDGFRAPPTPPRPQRPTPPSSSPLTPQAPPSRESPPSSGPKRLQRPALPGAPPPPNIERPSSPQPSATPQSDSPAFPKPRIPKPPGVPKPPSPPPASPAPSPSKLTSPPLPKPPSSEEEPGTRLQDPGAWDDVTPPGTALTPQVALPNQITLVLAQTNAPYILAGKTEYLIGREDPEKQIFPDLDLSLSGGDEGGVSRRHARITHRDSAYWIEDLDSLNYTFVNGVRLRPNVPHRLQDSDDIAFAKVRMRFHIHSRDQMTPDWGQP